MPDQQDALLKTNANVLTVAMLIGAAMFVALGVFLPQLSGMTGPEGTVMAIALYLAAAGDVAVAFYLRAKIKKAQQAASSGGTIQRQ